MTIDRRKVLAGMAGLGASTALPAWAQGIMPQRDPYAQVDPYADPRNGFPVAPAPVRREATRPTASGAFNPSASLPPLPDRYPLEDFQIAYSRENWKDTVKKNGGLYPDKEVQDAMWQFAEPFLRHAARQRLQWTAVVSNAPGINAFAATGGKLFFLPDLIAICDDPAELGAIVAHEIGHIDYDHAGRRDQILELLGPSLDKTLSPQDKKRLEMAVGINAMEALRRGWGLPNEFEADARSVALLSKVGMDPMKASWPFRKFANAFGPDEETDLFSTHPGNEERIRRIENAAVVFPRPQEEVTIPGWNVLKAAFPTPPKFKNA